MFRHILWTNLVASFLVFGCAGSNGVAQPQEPDPPKKPRTQFAEDRAGNGTTMIPFDSKRAMGYLEALCRIGPRVSGSEGMLRQQQLLDKHFTALGATIELQRFPARQFSRPKPVDMVNMIVRWHPERERRVLFCAHYDTRPIADQEPRREDWFKPFLSANDGTSGVAWLMELAHHMKDFPTAVGIDFVIVDGEEYIFEPGRDKFFFGSEYFASEHRKKNPRPNYIAGVVLDLFAGEGARYPIEQNSAFHAGRVVEEIWGIAKELGVKAFEYRRGPTVDDDHLALNRAGIPTVDIIDFDYQHWHRLSDVPANCSATSMDNVAKVLTVWLQRLK